VDSNEPDMTTICATICEHASAAGFVDPITKLPPRDECSLSALLCFYHHTGNIDWKKVPMISSNRAETGETAAAILAQSGYLGCEYPLFWETALELEARGGMRPDLLFLSSDQSTVAIVENKVGAADTHKGDEYGGQFGRYIKYLLDIHIEQRYMILLTSEFYIHKEPPWYLTELQEAEEIQGSREKVRSVVIVWEHVLRAFATSCST
jgi:hypothetical protein